MLAVHLSFCTLRQFQGSQALMDKFQKGTGFCTLQHSLLKLAMTVRDERWCFVPHDILKVFKQLLDCTIQSCRKFCTLQPFQGSQTELQVLDGLSEFCTLQHFQGSQTTRAIKKLFNRFVPYSIFKVLKPPKKP